MGLSEVLIGSDLFVEHIGKNRAQSEINDDRMLCPETSYEKFLK